MEHAGKLPEYKSEIKEEDLLYTPNPSEEAYAFYLLRTVFLMERDIIIRALKCTKKTKIDHFDNVAATRQRSNNNFLIDGATVVPFLSTSGIDRLILRNVWNAVDPANAGHVSSMSQFHCLLRLVTLAQTGILMRDLANSLQQQQQSQQKITVSPPQVMIRSLVETRKTSNFPLPSFEGITIPTLKELRYIFCDFYELHKKKKDVAPLLINHEDIATTTIVSDIDNARNDNTYDKTSDGANVLCVDANNGVVDDAKDSANCGGDDDDDASIEDGASVNSSASAKANTNARFPQPCDMHTNSRTNTIVRVQQAQQKTAPAVLAQQNQEEQIFGSSIEQKLTSTEPNHSKMLPKRRQTDVPSPSPRLGIHNRGTKTNKNINIQTSSANNPAPSHLIVAGGGGFSTITDDNRAASTDVEGLLPSSSSLLQVDRHNKTPSEIDNDHEDDGIMSYFSSNKHTLSIRTLWVDVVASWCMLLCYYIFFFYIMNKLKWYI